MFINRGLGKLFANLIKGILSLTLRANEVFFPFLVANPSSFWLVEKGVSDFFFTKCATSNHRGWKKPSVYELFGERDGQDQRSEGSSSLSK